MSGVLRKVTFILFCSLFIGVVSIGAAADAQFVSPLKCNKLGPKPADTDAEGKVVFHLDESKKELSYKIQVDGVKDAYMAHLHFGPEGKEGHIAAWLYPVDNHDSPDRKIAGEFSGTLTEGVIRPEDLKHGITFDELVETMQSGDAYVSIHTTKYVMGALRGQVQPSIGKLSSQ